MNIVDIQYQVKEIQGVEFKGSEDIYQAIKDRFNPVQEELYLLPCVGQEVAIERLFLGGLDCAYIDMKTIFHALLTKYPNAPTFFVAHNHPSGNLEPSPEDNKLTEKIKKAAELMGYIFLDHIIFTNKGYYSYIKAGNIL